MADTYHSQIKACAKYFDVDPKDLPYICEIDITGWDAHKVVRLLKSIVVVGSRRTMSISLYLFIFYFMT